MLLSQGVVVAAEKAAGGFNIMTLILPIALIAVFYLLLIRPQRKRQREMATMQQGIQSGQEVMTGAGIIGTVASVRDDEVSLEIAPGVEARFAKQAIVRTITPVDESDSTDSPSSSDSDEDGSTSSDESTSTEPSMSLTHDDGSKKN